MSVYTEVLGALSQCPPADIKKTVACIKEVNEVLARHGDHGNMAIAIIGAALSEGKSADVGVFVVEDGKLL